MATEGGNLLIYSKNVNSKKSNGISIEK